MEVEWQTLLQNQAVKVQAQARWSDRAMNTRCAGRGSHVSASHVTASHRGVVPRLDSSSRVSQTYLMSSHIFHHLLGRAS